MPGQAIIIQPSNFRIEDAKRVDLDVAPKLDFLSKAVEGHIETVPYFDHFEGKRCVTFCNEEGKLNGLGPNILAQVYWEEAFGNQITSDLLVGPICIITGDDNFLEQL